MIEELTNMPKTIVHRILTEDLQKKKVCARWVPHLLSPEEKQRRVTSAEEILKCLQSTRRMKILTGDENWFWLNQQQNKRQNMVWFSGDEERPDVLRQSFRSKKFMFTVFISNEKVQFVNMLPEGHHINGQYYMDTICQNLLPKFAGLPRGCIALLHHDNAPSHTCGMVTQFLKDNNIQLIPHPPYSPDLAPLDFWVFPQLKEYLSGSNFHRSQDLARAINQKLKQYDTD